MQKNFFLPTYLLTLFFSDRYRKQTISFFRPYHDGQLILTTTTTGLVGLTCWPGEHWAISWPLQALERQLSWSLIAISLRLRAWCNGMRTDCRGNNNPSGIISSTHLFYPRKDLITTHSHACNCQSINPIVSTYPHCENPFNMKHAKRKSA